MWKLAAFVTFVLILQLGILVEGQSVSIFVNCTNVSNIEIIISGVNDTEQWNETAWQLNSVSHESCRPTFDHGANTVTYIFSGSVCDSTVDNTLQHFVYVFLIDAVVPMGIPTVANDHQYNITCRYNKDGSVQSSFTPLHDLSAAVTETVPVFGSLVLSEDYFGGPPVRENIQIGTIIFVQLKINDPFLNGIDLSLRECYSTKDGISDGKFVFIRDSCKTSNDTDPFSLEYSCSNYTNETENFKIVVVRYPFQVNGDIVYIHCDFQVCFEDNSTSICRQRCQECDGTRKRRDVNQESTYEPRSTTYHLRAGPYRIVEDEIQGGKGAENGEQEAAVTRDMIIILCVSGVVATAIVCVTIVVTLYLKKKRLPINGNVVSTMAKANPACEACDINTTI